MINFVDAGGVQGLNDATTRQNNLNKLHSLMANTNIVSGAQTPSGKERGGPRIYFPPGNYYFSGPIRIKKTVYLMGSYAATRAGHQTAFIFPSGSQGIVIDNDDTDNLAYVAKPNSNPGAAGTTIEGIVVQGNGGGTDVPGILVRTYCVLKHVAAQNFSGNGIYIKATYQSELAGKHRIRCCSIAPQMIVDLPG